MSSEAIVQNYFEDAVSALKAYKKMADKAIAQMNDDAKVFSRQKKPRTSLGEGEVRGPNPDR